AAGSRMTSDEYLAAVIHDYEAAKSALAEFGIGTAADGSLVVLDDAPYADDPATPERRLEIAALFVVLLITSQLLEPVGGLLESNPQVSNDAIAEGVRAAFDEAFFNAVGAVAISAGFDDAARLVFAAMGGVKAFTRINEGYLRDREWKDQSDPERSLRI